MARVPKILYQGQPATTDTNLYVVPDAKKATVTSILAVNTGTATKYFSLDLVKFGDSPADDTKLAKMIKLVGTENAAGGGIWTMEFPIPLNTIGDKISGIQETATAITITIIGFEEGV